MTTIIRVDEHGHCSALKTEVIDWDTLGEVTVRRASHILPARRLKRLAFRALRFAFGERGRVAEWCRHWLGPWQVRFAETPNVVAYTNQSRRVCLLFEVQTLEKTL